MAINPNTNFTAGQILTADQQNRFGRGVVALATSTTRLDGQAAEVLSPGMSVTFTAVANRYYKVSYREGALGKATSSSPINIRVRFTNLAGAEVAAGVNYAEVNTNMTIEASIIRTFTAGSVTLVGTCETGAGTFNYRREVFSATLPAAYLLVEDLGPA
jgi:hypothetical protein